MMYSFNIAYFFYIVLLNCGYDSGAGQKLEAAADDLSCPDATVVELEIENPSIGLEHLR